LFTGLIQATGTVTSFEGGRLTISLPPNAWEDPVSLGESIAVNGCCLTLAHLNGGASFDLSEETLRRTTLGSLETGTAVNLERALRAGDRLGGHFVQGHVDGTGELVARTSAEGGEVFRFRLPAQFEEFLVDKGSIALDGISLTVVSPQGPEFDVWVIPETLARTNLGGLHPGTKVNVEGDMLLKHIARMMGKE
jgi:riboflavin synthase